MSSEQVRTLKWTELLEKKYSTLTKKIRLDTVSLRSLFYLEIIDKNE